MKIEIRAAALLAAIFLALPVASRAAPLFDPLPWTVAEARRMFDAAVQPSVKQLLGAWEMAGCLNEDGRGIFGGGCSGVSWVFSSSEFGLEVTQWTSGKVVGRHAVDLAQKRAAVFATRDDRVQVKRYACRIHQKTRLICRLEDHMRDRDDQSVIFYGYTRVPAQPRRPAR